MVRKYGDVEWNQMDAVKNRAKCFEKLLDVDRGDWNNFHEDFVRILVKFGYRIIFAHKAIS
jgi:hypothetical protein